MTSDELAKAKERILNYESVAYHAAVDTTTRKIEADPHQLLRLLKDARKLLAAVEEQQREIAFRDKIIHDLAEESDAAKKALELMTENELLKMEMEELRTAAGMRTFWRTRPITAHSAASIRLTDNTGNW